MSWTSISRVCLVLRYRSLVSITVAELKEEILDKELLTSTVLRDYAEEHTFLSPEWHNFLYDFKDNQSVVGFTAEQIIISKLASAGLVLDRVPITSFTSNITRLGASAGSYYYGPVRFNLIDLLYVQISERKGSCIVNVTGIQITIDKRRRYTREAFFNQ